MHIFFSTNGTFMIHVQCGSPVSVGVWGGRLVLDIPCFLESQNMMCVFFGLSSASSMCNVPFSFSIFCKCTFIKIVEKLLATLIVLNSHE